MSPLSKVEMSPLPKMGTYMAERIMTLCSKELFRLQVIRAPRCTLLVFIEDATGKPS
jgi:hypothetical protein